jgi:hypothetical protein
MNSLEKLNALLSGDGRIIKYGVLTEEEDALLISLQIGESEATKNSIGDRSAAFFPTLIVGVYSSDYLAGFDLIEQIKNEIKLAGKDNLKIFHFKDMASEYVSEKQKYLFKSLFREIQI